MISVAVRLLSHNSVEIVITAKRCTVACRVGSGKLNNNLVVCIQLIGCASCVCLRAEIYAAVSEYTLERVLGFKHETLERGPLQTFGSIYTIVVIVSFVVYGRRTRVFAAVPA